ncbi:hypothetical protein Hanom_Chr06g00550751 [Helianthus anomalus]
MFGGRAKGFDMFENKSEIELEEEHLDKFYDGLDVDNGHRNDKEKFKEYVEDFYKKEFEIEREKNKKLNDEGTLELCQRADLRSQEKEDVTEDDMIIESCLEALDLILLHEELAGYDKFYSGSFEGVLLWFIPCFLGIFKENTMPPTLIDGSEVSLIFATSN